MSKLAERLLPGYYHRILSAVDDFDQLFFALHEFLELSRILLDEKDVDIHFLVVFSHDVQLATLVEERQLEEGSHSGQVWRCILFDELIETVDLVDEYKQGVEGNQVVLLGTLPLFIREFLTHLFLLLIEGLVPQLSEAAPTYELLILNAHPWREQGRVAVSSHFHVDLAHAPFESLAVKEGKVERQ